MRAVVADGAGGPEVLSVADVADVEPGVGEVAIAVAATAINRADLLQRQSFYPPPPGASEVLGLECSGEIAAVGEGVTDWQVGDRVCALLAGGGYASRVVCAAGQVMPVPNGVDLVSAAALPEVACTVWSNVFMVAGIKPHESFLVHGGAGGIGSFAIQLVHQLGARVFTTGGTREKLAFCAELGADVTISYRDQDFVEVVREQTDGAGVDVILDNMGAKYLGRNVDALATEGRLVVIGMQGGTKGRARPQRPAAQARRRDRYGVAQPAGRREVRDLRLGRRTRVAAGGRGAGAADRAHDDAARRRRRRARADGVRRPHREDRADGLRRAVAASSRYAAGPPLPMVSTPWEAAAPCIPW